MTEPPNPFTLEEALVARRSETPYQAVGSPQFSSDLDTNFLCDLREVAYPIWSAFLQLHGVEGSLTKMEVRMGAFMIHHSEELMVSQHLSRV